MQVVPVYAQVGCAYSPYRPWPWPRISPPVRGPAQPTRARARSAPATLGFAPPLAAGSYRVGSSFAWASWLREVTPGFRNTLRRW